MTQEPRKAATGLKDLNFKSEFISEETYDDKKTKITVFTSTVVPNNSRAKLNAEDEKKLYNNFKNLVDPLFGKNLIMMFLQADLNDFDDETGKPEKDKSMWVNIIDPKTKQVKKDKYGQPIINIFRLESKYNIEWDEKGRIHSHIMLEIEHDGNVLVDLGFYRKYLTERWYKLTGEYKAFHTGLFIKRTDYKHKFLNYMKNDKCKKKAKET